MNYSAIDLFCGVGGLTHGLIKSGIKVYAGFDIDNSCKYAYEKNNKTVFINKAIEDLTSEDILKLYPEGDLKILVGCAPCQPFSKHTQKNKRRNRDKKWKLINYFAELIKSVQPEIISMENVPALAEQKIFADFIRSIKHEGYKTYWKVIYCPKYGIPQKRSRLVLLASKLGKIELIPEKYKPNEYLSVQKAIGHLRRLEDGEICNTDSLHRSAKLSAINKKRILQSKPGGSWLDWDEELLASCHKKESGHTYTSVYSRMKWEEPSPTITTQFYSYGTGRFGHPEQNRALSLREGALLQTFPENYEFVEPGQPIYFKKVGCHIGNAVPVELGKVIGESIIRHIESLSNS